MMHGQKNIKLLQNM